LPIEVRYEDGVAVVALDRQEAHNAFDRPQLVELRQSPLDQAADDAIRDRATFGQPEVQLALIPGWGGTQRLPRVFGLGVAKNLILTGEPVDAYEALTTRRRDWRLPSPEMLDRLLETAQALAKLGPGVRRAG
jgi:enoyl-CoA hydratase/carnithine racemase